MPQAEFEPTIPAFERGKTVDALDRPATMTGSAYPFAVPLQNICLEEGGSKFLRNVSNDLQDYTASDTRRHSYSQFQP
jgi:hypothetical protein